MVNKCCGRSLKTGAAVVGIFYLVVSVCFLIFCIVEVTSASKGSLLESSILYKLLPKTVRDKLSVLSTQEKDEVFKSIQHPLLKSENPTPVREEVSGLVVGRLIITVFHVLSNLSLVVGVWKEDGNLVFTWLWTQVVLFFVTSGMAAILVLDCIGDLNVPGECLLVASIVFYVVTSAYCFVIVDGFYCTLYQPSARKGEDYERSTLQLA